MSFQTIRLVIAAIGVAIWVYGYSADDNRVRWVGIAVLAVSVFLRFVTPRRAPDTTKP